MRINTVFFLALLLPASLFAATCPSVSCPADRETPIVWYAFEGDLSDSSGHNVPAGEDISVNGAVTFHSGIGGRPGMSVGGFLDGAGRAVSLPACAFWGSEGEIEWYQYLTATPAVWYNTALWWCTIGCLNGGIAMYTGLTAADPTAIQLSYSYLESSVVKGETFGAQCLVYNTWQHFSFQWGSFGTRLIVDGIPRAGSVIQWYNGPPDISYPYLGEGPSGHLFMGYIDDFKIWPCAGHGTFTETPTLTPEKTHTVTPTCTVTGTYTITETATITETCTFVPTLTVTETHTISPTHTFSPTPSPTFTPQDTPTVTPTRSGTRFTGIFPNPVRLNARIVFTSEVPCQAELILYNVAGETALVASVPASAGLNAVEFEPKNSSGKKLASGVYLYRFELKQPGNTRIYAGKLAIAR